MLEKDTEWTFWDALLNRNPEWNQPQDEEEDEDGQEAEDDE